MATTVTPWPPFVWFMLLGYAVLCVLWLIAAKKGYLSRRMEKLLLNLLYVLVWVGAGVIIAVAVRECPVQTEISHEQVNSQTGTWSVLRSMLGDS